MKVFIFILNLFTILNLNSQNSFDQEVAKTIEIIEKGLTVSNIFKNDFKYEFYVYDINFDSIGKISNVGVVRMESSILIDSIQKLALKIKANWTIIKHPFKKLLIPVFIINSNFESEESNYDLSIKEMAVFFQKLSFQFKTDNVYVSRLAMITWATILK